MSPLWLLLLLSMIIRNKVLIFDRKSWFLIYHFLNDMRYYFFLLIFYGTDREETITEMVFAWNKRKILSFICELERRYMKVRAFLYNWQLLCYFPFSFFRTELILRTSWCLPFLYIERRTAQRGVDSNLWFTNEVSSFGFQFVHNGLVEWD